MLMKILMRSIRFLALLPFLAFMTGASDLSGGGCGANPIQTFSVGGTVSGLSGTLILQNNGGDNLTLTGDGDFVFSEALEDGADYSVTVLTHPDGQVCTISNGSGVVAGANVTNIEIACSASAYTLGGTVSGLSGTVVLQNSDSQEVSVSAEGSFQFANALADGSSYSVSVLTQPDSQTCSVTNASGTIDDEDVSNVTVTCSDNPTYSISGDLSNLNSSLSVELQIRVGDGPTVTLSSNGSSQTLFSGLEDGTSYEINVLTEPTNQVCNVTNGTGTISGGDVSDVVVTCSRYLFVSASANNGNLGGVAGADAKCNSDSNKPNGSTYKALIAADTGSSLTSRIACETPNCSGGDVEHVDWVLQPSTPYVRPDGTLIGTTNSLSLFAFPLDNAFASSFAFSWSGIAVATGFPSATDWTTSVNTCSAWTSSAPLVDGTQGFSSLTLADSISGASVSCNDTSALLVCAEQ